MSAIAIHVGLNEVDPRHYAGWSGPLVACEADAEDMQELCNGLGYQTEVLLTAKATRSGVLGALARAANTLVAGDHLVLTYSGHGGQLPDVDGDENDSLDETWCLYDAEMSDDELYDALAKFAPGVRILLVSDSCHSGTVVKRVGSTVDLDGYRAMPPRVAAATYRQNQTFYEGLARRVLGRRADVKASVILLSGCQDNQLSADGAFNGLFTANLLRVWARGTFVGDHKSFWIRIAARMPPTQSPNYFAMNPDPGFERMSPFRTEETVDGLAILKRGLELQPPAQRADFEAGAAKTTRASLGMDASQSFDWKAGPASRGGTVVRGFWWGFHIEISHEDLAAAVGGTNTAGTIVAAIGPITGPAAPFVIAAGAFVAATGAAMAAMDRGRGIYLSMSWFALGVFIPTPV